jgi:hypothetical protein
MFFVFVRDPDTEIWSQQFRGTSTVAGTNTNFVAPGIALSASGDTLALYVFVDAFFSAVTVYVRSGTTWTIQQTLIITDDQPSVTAGNIAISSSGNTLAVGTSSDSEGGEGHIYVWVRSAGAWTLQAKLTPAAPIGVSVGFCYNLAITSDGNLIAGSGPADDGNTGAVWMFSRTGTTWTEIAKAVPAAPITLNNGFGNAGVRLSGSGDTLVVGSYSYFPTGAMWVFQRSGAGSWLQQGLVYISGSSNFLYTTGLAVSKDGQTLATTDYTATDLTIRVWRRSLTDFVPIAIITKAIDSPIGALALSGDATTMIANAGQQGTNGAVAIFV